MAMTSQRLDDLLLKKTA